MEQFIAAHYYTTLAAIEALRTVFYAFFTAMLWLIWTALRPQGHQCDDLCGRSGEFCGNCGHHEDAHVRYSTSDDFCIADTEKPFGMCYCDRMER